MAVLGGTAFGIDFDTFTGSGGGEIVEAARVSFANAAPPTALVVMLVLLLPEPLAMRIWSGLTTAERWWRGSRGGSWLMQRSEQLRAARDVVFATSIALLRNARKRAGVPDAQNTVDTGLLGTGVELRYADRTPAKGSLMDLLSQAKDPATGRPLEDWQIVPQANTMILAGG